ncbi:MAG: TonB-dependent receptor [Sphingomonadaceae bacterium]|nr:TonB-dependent receptor [Sphingomonadaceae bacterium]
MMLCAGAALGLLMPTAHAAAQGQGTPAPAPSPPAPSPPAGGRPPAPERRPENDIVVTAPAQQSSIDRQTYLVRDTPEARSATTSDILARIPSVEVQDDGSVRLIGAGSATVLIDGRRVADPQTQLRNMTGNQIERIEVLTNPGAQFPAQGTGGIVNIVTRRNTQNGLGGSATASVANHAGYDLRVSPTYGAGNWTFTGSFGHGGGENPYRFERDRFLLAQGGPVPPSSEAGSETDEYRYYYGNSSASYRPDDRRTITLAGTLAHTDLSQDRTSLLIAPAIPGGSADQRSTNEANFDYRDLALDYRGTSARQGELLTASVKWARFSGDFDSLFLLDPAAAAANSFHQQRTMLDESWTGKADYVRPFRGASRLSIGAQLVTTSNRFVQDAIGALPSGAPFAASSVVEGSWLEYAGYVTYQFALAGFTIMPGVRFEGREYDLGGTTGVPDLKTSRLFPSLHVERQLAPWLTGSASYSRRITYPGIQQLNPALNFTDATAAQAGNPLLQPQLTDSWEARLRGTLGRHSLELTAFRRTTEDIWSFRGEFDPTGVLITRPFNFGSQALTGAELSARGPILSGLRYVLTANLSDQGLDPDAGGPLPGRHSATWSGTGQLEYRDGQDGRAGADRVNLTLRYFGATDTGFTRVSPLALATFTWSHAITDRLSAVLTVTNLRFSEGRETITTGVTTRSRDLIAPPSPQRISLALTWSFRRPGQGPRVQQQQQQQGGPPPIPGAGPGS